MVANFQHQRRLVKSSWITKVTKVVAANRIMLKVTPAKVHHCWNCSRSLRTGIGALLLEGLSSTVWHATR
jgi:hypothetical protein